MQLLEALLQLKNLPCAEPGLPATEKELLSAEKQFGSRLPDEARKLFSACNGMNFDLRDLQLFSLSEALSELSSMSMLFEDYQAFRPFPVFKEWTTGNVFCIACDGPISGYLTCVSLGDNASIDFRTIAELLLAINDAIQKDQFILASPFQESEQRTDRDIQVAIELLSAAEKLNDDPASTTVNMNRFEMLSFAVELLSADHVAKIAPLLNDNSLVQNCAEMRLKRIGTPAANLALSNYFASGKGRDLAEPIS